MSDFPNGVGIEVDERGTTAIIKIDSHLYSKDVAIKAAYWLADRCYVHIRRAARGGFVAEIRTKDGKSGDALTAACGEFCNSLIDFALRTSVADQTRNIHEAMLQRAFTELIPLSKDG